MPWADQIAGLGVGLRREVRDLFGFEVRETVEQRVTITVTDQPSPSAGVKHLGTTRMRSDQTAELDPDFRGRLSGQNVDLAVSWSVDDPEGIARFEEIAGDGDRSIGRLTPTPGSGGIVTVTWSAENGDEIITGSETFEIAGEAVTFAGQTVEVTDQPAS